MMGTFAWFLPGERLCIRSSRHKFLAPGIKRFVIEAPRIARKQKPGQFVIFRICEEGERIPVTIENSDPAKGTINIAAQAAGKTTLLNSRETGGSILDVVGPPGKPSEIANYRAVVVVGGGVGSAMAYPVTAALKLVGNRVISIVGRAQQRTTDDPRAEMRRVSDPVMITTDEGSHAGSGHI